MTDWAALRVAGTAHLTWSWIAFGAQVPRWLPLPTDLVVVGSALVELALGDALIALPRYRTAVGWIVAACFVAIFPGNIVQYRNRIDAFGLHSDPAVRTTVLSVHCRGRWSSRSRRPGHRLGDS